VHVSGSGVPQDNIEGYKWFSLAATYANGTLRRLSAEARDTDAELLTPEQRAEGQKLAREFFETHPSEGFTPGRIGIVDRARERDDHGGGARSIAE
jgi:hypothetical protein